MEYPIKTMAALNNEPPLNWIIPGWIPSRELSCFWGDPGVYKSFIAQGLSLQLAAQNRIKVVYVAAEGASGLSARVHAWNALNFGDAYREDPNWHYMPSNVNYESRDNRRDFVNSIYQLIDTDPDLIVLDTLARNFFGDENSAKEMGQFIEGVEETRRDCGCAVWIIHHANVSHENRRERGSAALRAAMFAMFHISDPRETKRGVSVQLECDRMKDGEIPEPMRVDLHRVRLESDQEGDVFSQSLALPHFPTRARTAGTVPGVDDQTVQKFAKWCRDGSSAEEINGRLSWKVSAEPKLKVMVRHGLLEHSQGVYTTTRKGETALA